ncbi:MAG: polysaccharide deacetylase family protein [Proteobacteria bacterium]|nr:polysaccharide deacetylase family protein [Pseudomonadota bacterium]
MNVNDHDSNDKSLPWRNPPLTKFHIASGVSIIVFTGLFWINYQFALAFAVVYLFLIAIAPYFLKLAFFLPIINKAPQSTSQIALTFDDGPDPAVTEPLLDLLKRYQVKTTFFVTGSKAKESSHLIRRMIQEGHEIGNHTQHHDVFLMLRGKRTIRREIEDCQDQLISGGIKTFAFRPPVGITNPRLHNILLQLGMYCVGFSCRPRDFGNRKTKDLGNRILSKIKGGDIVLLHDCKPYPEFSVADWLSEVERLMNGLKQKQLQAVLLSTLINRPVMEKISHEIF